MFLCTNENRLFGMISFNYINSLFHIQYKRMNLFVRTTQGVPVWIISIRSSKDRICRIWIGSIRVIIYEDKWIVGILLEWSWDLTKWMHRFTNEIVFRIATGVKNNSVFSYYSTFIPENSFNEEEKKKIRRKSSKKRITLLFEN